MTIAISRSAHDDLLDGYRFYKIHGQPVAEAFFGTVLSEIDSLAIFAGTHRKVWGFHRALIKRFPFAIYYKVEDDTVRVLRVLDCRRNPKWIRDALG